VLVTAIPVVAIDHERTSKLLRDLVSEIPAPAGATA
jgi:hypothetical protein